MKKITYRTYECTAYAAAVVKTILICFGSCLPIILLAIAIGMVYSHLIGFAFMFGFITPIAILEVLALVDDCVDDTFAWLRNHFEIVDSER